MGAQKRFTEAKPPADRHDPAVPHARSGTCTATHLLAPCPLNPLSRGTAPAAARIECSLAIGLPAHGGWGALLSGARRGSVGAETKVGSLARRFCIGGQAQQQQPGRGGCFPTTRLRWRRRRGAAGRTCCAAVDERGPGPRMQEQGLGRHFPVNWSNLIFTP